MRTERELVAHRFLPKPQPGWRKHPTVLNECHFQWTATNLPEVLGGGLPSYSISLVHLVSSPGPEIPLSSHLKSPTTLLTLGWWHCLFPTEIRNNQKRTSTCFHLPTYQQLHLSELPSSGSAYELPMVPAEANPILASSVSPFSLSQRFCSLRRPISFLQDEFSYLHTNIPLLISF